MWIILLIVIITQIIITIRLCRKDKSLTTSTKTKQSMQNFLKNLKRRYWYSCDKNIVLIFEEIKGIATVKVTENGYYGKEGYISSSLRATTVSPLSIRSPAVSQSG